MPRNKKNSGSTKILLLEPLESRQLLSANASEIVSPSLIVEAASRSSTTIAGYTPSQIETAYGISSIKLDGVSGTGAGQTIAIVDAYSDPNIASDLSVFDKEFSLAAPPSFIHESAKGSKTKLPMADAGWDSEISLDVEWAHAIAPKADIILVDAASDSMSSLMAAVKFARSITSVSVISMSWGGSEFSSETAYDSYFTTPSGHIGITFVAASGDDGAAGGADYPAASPNVLSVGGTTLSLTNSNNISSETAWSDSEGGVSAYEPTPSYQSGISTSGRSTPDVSYDADPNTGFAVYDSVSYEGASGWQEVGGTSAGTPQWSALIAIADQGRVKNGLSTLTTTQTLDELYGIYSNATSYAADFNDITSGSSVISEGGGGFGGPFGGGRFGGGRFRQLQEVSATTGYDTLTGLGTPKATSLVETLAAAKVSSSAVAKTAVTTAKATKTTRAAAALEFEKVASVFGVKVAEGSSLLALQRDESNIEVETASAATAATIVLSPKYATSVSILDDRSLSSVAGAPMQAAAADRDASMIQSDFARVSSSASALALKAETDTAEIVSGAAAGFDDASRMPELFSGVSIGHTFRDALGRFADSLATPKVSAAQPKEPTSSIALVGVAAMAAEAIWIGYWYAKRRRDDKGESAFSDEPLV
jgi:hypothetical protein